MKISLNWLKEYVNVPEGITNTELISLIGSRLVEVEGVIDETHKYDGITVVRVEKAEKIPDTHLTLCQVYDGSPELVQVVCGAPNVREGMLAAWIRPGAIVPASVHEAAPFVIGKRKMLSKYDSNGMLAGADELDFGDDHSGIVEIDPSMAKPGDTLADVFELNDLILEIENKSLTHRPDCFGIIGFAREVAGILGIKFDSVSETVSRNSYENFEASEPRDDGSERAWSRELESDFITIDSDVCSRYTAVVLEKHGELGKKYLTLQDTRLAKAGMKPVERIVDATNYLMLLTGQPLHAFDLDKFIKVGNTEKPKIIVRLAKKGEKLVLLDGKEIICNENDVLITSNDVPVALAGAMGGESTMIDENTRNILLESATFSLYNLRKTQMEHGVFSEAITRFTKGQPPYQTMEVALECAEMLKDGFKIAGIADNYPKPEESNVVKNTTTEINNLLGTDYEKDLIIQTLTNVGFQVNVSTGPAAASSPAVAGAPSGVLAKKASPVDILSIESPAWRTDIHIKEDIIEEVGRLLGYDNIEPTLPLHRTAEKNASLELKREIRNCLSMYGANEVLTYSFVSEKLLEKAKQDKKNSYKIVNSISPELQYIRQSIVPSLLEKTFLNEKLPVEKFAIFEMNQVYRKEWGVTKENVPVERNSLGFVVAERKGEGTAFYKAKKYVELIFREMQIVAEYVPIKSKTADTKPFEPKRSAEILVNGEYVGVVGEFKNSVRHEFKLADYLAGFEIDLDLVLEYRSNKKEIKIGAKKTEDLTVATTKSYAETLKEVQEKYPEAEISPLSIYQAEGEEKKNISFRIAF